MRSTIAFIEGRYDDSETLTAEALVLGQESGDYNADLVFYAQGLLRAVDQGQAGEVLPLLWRRADFQHIASFTRRHGAVRRPRRRERDRPRHTSTGW